MTHPDSASATRATSTAQARHDNGQAGESSRLFPRLLRSLSLDRSSAALRLNTFAAPLILCLVWLFHAFALRAWLNMNVLPNGYQNEIFHLGNALDLWVAWQQRDWHLLHSLLFKQYWPPFHYLVAFPLLFLEISRDAFVYSNLIFLALLLASTYALGRRLDSGSAGLLAAILLSFFPSIYGNLRHFEPNVPLTAMVTFSMWALSASHRFTHRGYSALFGLAVGLTLYVDRISGVFFLALPSLAVIVAGLMGNRRHSRIRRHHFYANIGLATAIVLILVGYYYFNFFRLYSEEILPQAVDGEILSTGERSEFREPLAPTTLFFYPNTLLDGQVGFVMGLLLSLALLLTVRARDRRHRLLWIWLLGAFALFTIIQKKQLYYTIPVLPAFALLSAAGLTRLSLKRLIPPIFLVVFVVALQQHQVSSFGKGLFPERFMLPLGQHSRLIDLSLLGGRSPIPPHWVSPRYPQSWPPSKDDLKVDELLAAVRKLKNQLPTMRIESYSEDQTFFEGYLTFFLRADNPTAIVNGLLLNPQGFYENIRLTDAFVYVTPSRRLFPTPESIHSMLTARGSLKYAEGLPIVSVLEAQARKLRLAASLETSYGTKIHVYGLRPWEDFAEPE